MIKCRSSPRKLDKINHGAVAGSPGRCAAAGRGRAGGGDQVRLIRRSRARAAQQTLAESLSFLPPVAAVITSFILFSAVQGV